MMGENKRKCNCDVRTYQLKATGYILCLDCGKQTKKQGDE